MCRAVIKVQSQGCTTNTNWGCTFSPTDNN